MPRPRLPQKWNRIKSILAEQENIDFEDNEQAVDEIWNIVVQHYSEEVKTG